MHVAARRGHKDIAEMLIEAGADVNKADEDRGIPLSWAINRRHKDIAEFLRKAGAKDE